MHFRKIRHRLAVGFLIITSLISGVYSFYIHPPKLLVTNDGTVQWEARMQAVRERLPDSVQEIGYIAGSENLGSMIEEYRITKFFLIPIAVHQGTDYEWIIGNFTQPHVQEILDTQIPEGYTVEKLGAGVYLIHRCLP